MDYNLSVQHEIMPNTVLEVGYVGTKGTHLLGDVDIQSAHSGDTLGQS